MTDAVHVTNPFEFAKVETWVSPPPERVALLAERYAQGRDLWTGECLSPSTRIERRRRPKT